MQIHDTPHQADAQPHLQLDLADAAAPAVSRVHWTFQRNGTSRMLLPELGRPRADPSLRSGATWSQTLGTPQLTTC